WRSHLLARLCALIGAELAFCPEMKGIRSGSPTELGVTIVGFDDGFDWRLQRDVQAMIEQDVAIYGAALAYFERLVRKDGVCHSLRELIDDGLWYSSTSYQLIHRPLGVDHALWCFGSLPGGGGDEFAGVILQRANGARDFSPRERQLLG